MTENPGLIRAPRSGSFLERLLLGEAVSGYLAPLALLLILLITVEGTVPQLEMFLSGGYVPVPMMVVKFLFTGIVVFSLAIRPRCNFEHFPLGAWLLFVGYLVLDVQHLLGQNLTLLQVLSQDYGYYSLILLLPFMGVMSSTLRKSIITNSLVIAFWICAALGFIQHLLNSPVLYTESVDGTFQVPSWQFSGTEEIRCFSLFAHGIDFGLFCTLVGMMGLYSFLQGRKIWSGIAVYLAAALCTYFTLTRVTYVVFFVATIAVFSLRYGKTVRLVRFCFWFNLILGGVVAYGGATDFLAGSSSVTDNISLLERLEEFVYYWSIYSGGNFAQKLFGMGIVQDVKANGIAIYPIDNLFMALLLHIGIIGLIFFMFLFWAIWQRVSLLAKERACPLTVGVCAVWSSFLAISLFDISTAFFPLCAMLLILCDLNVENTTQILALQERTI